MNPQKYLSEATVQNEIKNNSVIQNDIISALGIDCSNEAIIDFWDEDVYINRITADFTLIINQKIKALIECKAGNINVTDYVRGIGQLFQYEYFCENKIPHKSIDYYDDFITVYLFPSSVLKINDFNIAKFKYPKSTKILELNENNNAIRLISEKDLQSIGSADDNLITISPYYFRDNRLFEYYILLKHLLNKKNMGYEKCDRKTEECNLKKLNTINNGNWRNAFITIANLGLIDKNNLPTKAGSNLAILEYEEFAYSMYCSYIKPYVEELYKILDKKNITITNSEICENVKNIYHGKDVMYLTQSAGRYVSSWMNIMRDDYGMINFLPRHNEREIIYNPIELNEVGFKNKIKEYSIAYNYIKKYQEMLRKGEL